MANKTTRLDSVSRRKLLKTGAVGVGALIVGSAPAAASEPAKFESGSTGAASDHEDEDEEDDYDEDEEYDSEVDSPDGFEVEVLASHAPFPDDLTARFCLEYAEDHHGDPIRVDVDDASTVVVAKATWTEDSTSGWHLHPGPYVVNMVEGEIEITHEHDCVPRTYAAGDAWFGTGDVHVADSEDGATAYVTFLGIPDGEPATEWVEPVEC
jgi:hypothetical protein